MNYYKKNGKVYAFNDLQVKKGIDDSFVTITKAEAELLANPPKTFEELKKEALSQALNEFNKACDVITQNAPPKEIDSWKKQEDEARAWVTDNTAPTPLIDGLLLSRALAGETKAILVQKIIDNSDLWATAYSEVLGTYQNRTKRINSPTTTITDIEAVIAEMTNQAP